MQLEHLDAIRVARVKAVDPARDERHILEIVIVDTEREVPVHDRLVDQSSE